MKSKLIMVLVILLALFATYNLFGYFGSYWSCRSHWKDSTLDFKYKIGVGCMVSTDKGWVPSENYRID